MMGFLDHNAVGAVPLARPGRERKSVDFLTNAAAVLIGIFFFFSPFPHTTAIKEISFYSSLFIVLILASFMKRDFVLKTPFTLPFLLFLIWAIIGIFFTLDQSNTIHDIYAHNIKYLFLYYILFNFYQSEKKFTLLVWIIIISVSIFCVGGLFYFYGLQRHSMAERFGFIEMSINYLCVPTITAMLLSFNLYKYQTTWKSKIILLFAGAITCLATLLTQTRGALIALIISILLLSIGRKKAVLLLLTGVAILIFIIPGFSGRLNDRDSLFNDRIAMNRLSLEIIKDHPITGIGFGMMIYANPDFLESYHAKVPKDYRFGSGILVPSPHNVFFDITVRTGIIGLIAFCFMLGTFFHLVWKLFHHANSFVKDWGQCLFAIFCSIIIQGFFMDITFGPQAVFFYMTLSMVSILWRLSLSAIAIRPSANLKTKAL